LTKRHNDLKWQDRQTDAGSGNDEVHGCGPQPLADRKGVHRVSQRGNSRAGFDLQLCPVPTTIYKICDSALWREAERAGVFTGAEIDARDGFIHFSSAAQVAETAAKHFAGAANLTLVAVDAAALGDALKWEASRGGDLFPHLYGALPVRAVLWAKPLPLGPDGRHLFPELAP
jgi:uncharacterized protein (DUF952 family)